jgi:hypothetical protein
VATFIQLIGFIVIAVGVWFIFPPAAVIAGGIFVVLFGLGLERVNNAGSNSKT